MYIGRLIEELSGLVERAEKPGHRSKLDVANASASDEKEHSDGHGGAAEKSKSQAEQLP